MKVKVRPKSETFVKLGHVVSDMQANRRTDIDRQRRDHRNASHPYLGRSNDESVCVYVTL